MALAGAVLQSQRRTAGVAQLGNGRRRQRVDEGITDARQCHLGTLGQGSGRVLRTLALVPVLQRHEGDGRVLAVAAEREAQHADGVLDLGLRHHELLDLLHGIQRALLRGTGRQLDVHHDVALVLVGQEARGDAHEEEGRDTDDDAIEQHPPGRTPDDAGHAAFIALGRAGKAAVEPAEEAALGMMVAGLDRLQERGAQRRRERQRQEGREADGGGHDRRELAVDVAHRAAEEGQRDEHRDQHHGHAHDGARDLTHGLDGGLPGRQPLLAHDPLDVLHHDDGVVHHDADHQHHAEHREHVDGHAQREQHAEGGQQRHRHHDGGNEGVADVLKEQEHHQEHQQDGFCQRVLHLLDGDVHEVRGIVGHLPFHALREELLQLLHLGVDGTGRGQRVAGVGQHHADASGGLAVDAGGGGIALTPQLDARHVLQAHGRTAGGGAQHDVAEFLDRAELARDVDIGRDRRAVHIGQCTGGAG